MKHCALLLMMTCAFVGCAHKTKAPNMFSDVVTIQLKDGTDPLLIHSTTASRVRDYVEIGLTHLGYRVCSECPHDAEAIVEVSRYENRQTLKLNLLSLTGAKNLLNIGVSEWSLTITRKGETIFDKSIEHEKAEPIDQLSARQVKDVLSKIPARKLSDRQPIGTAK